MRGTGLPELSWLGAGTPPPSDLPNALARTMTKTETEKRLTMRELEIAKMIAQEMTSRRAIRTSIVGLAPPAPGGRSCERGTARWLGGEGHRSYPFRPAKSTNYSLLAGRSSFSIRPIDPAVQQLTARRPGLDEAGPFSALTTERSAQTRSPYGSATAPHEKSVRRPTEETRHSPGRRRASRDLPPCSRRARPGR